MPPTLPTTAGPSKPLPRVSNFLPDDSDYDDDGTEDVGTNGPLTANGTLSKSATTQLKSKLKGKASKRQRPNQDNESVEPESGVASANASPAAKRKAVGSVNEGERRRLKEVADKLLQQRYELPFYQGRQMILEEIIANDTVVIMGETGCGKSTQLGQLLRTHRLSLDHFGGPARAGSSANGESSRSHSDAAEADRHRRGPSIAITQPRRLPSISLATRVAAEMGVTLGAEVGYSVRFEDATSRDTRVRFMTEGVMMRELANGASERKEAGTTKEEAEVAEDEEGLNLLLRYDVVVIDEAHERTLNTDFLLGCLKKIQRIRKELARASATEQHDGKSKPRRKIRELKIVIMSATLDPTKFTTFFDNCPALKVPGRLYSVRTSHTAEPVDDFIESAAECTMQVHLQKPAEKGDVLVFMPGSEEIENLVALLRRRSSDLDPEEFQLQVLPLYASLPPTAQAKIFQPTPPNTRRIVVATNIAETSLTIPGIAFVIDSGYKKEKEFIYRTSGAIEHLRKMPISQASAWQRTGRAGREMEGKCFRLYTESVFRSMDEFDKPEIQRCNLASAVLQLIAMRQDPFTFDYLDPPSRDSVTAAFRTLAGLGAIDSPTSITPLGTEMLKYPLDPEHARILVASFDLNCTSEIIDILSLVVSGPVFLDRSDDRDAATAARSKFLHRDGDHLTAMNVLRAYLAIKDEKSTKHSAKGHKGKAIGGGAASWCKDNHVNSKTLQAAIKVRTQLRELAERNGRDPKTSCGSEYATIGRCLLQGLFMNTAVIQADGTYRQTAGSLQVKIHPSSVLMSRKLPAIVYDELAITSSIYARNVSAFEQHLLAEVPWFQRAKQAVAQPISRADV